LEFIYDPMGNRIAKIVKPRPGGVLTDEVDWIFTYYTFDAGGNVMAVYNKVNTLDVDVLTEFYTLQEQNIYGSSRIGLVQNDFFVARRVSDAVDNSGFYDENGYFHDITNYNSAPALVQYDAPASEVDLELIVGRRRYELSNHLGNVLEVITDRKIAIDNAGDISHYMPDVVTWTDYWPFGMMLPGR